MPTKPTLPLVSRAEWLGSRAALAGQRSARFVAAATGIFVVALIATFVVPALPRPRTVGSMAAGPAPDTATLLRQAVEARQRLARADSQMEVTVGGFTAPLGTSARLTSAQRKSRDSLQLLATALEELLDRATKAPLPASFHALAAAIALRGDSRTKALGDSLDALEQHRAALGPTTGAERAAAEITEQVNVVGAQIRGVATRRLTRLARDLTLFEATSRAAADSLVPRAERESARAEVQHAESLVTAARAHDAEFRQGDTPREIEPVRWPVSPVALLVASLILVVCSRFGWSLTSEVRRPTIGSAREAERAAGAPVIAIARSPAVTRSHGGIDPFRMLYLALTATGTKMRTVAIAGDERGVVAMVAARLALAAAGDARATLVVDSDAEGSALGGYYHLPPEPGYTDAVAGVRLWREVTHSIGASEGLPIDVVAGGAIRREAPDQVTLEAARAEFARVRGEYDLCVVVAPSAAALQRVSALIETPITVLCAEFGTTPISWVLEEAAKARAVGAVLHGLVLWNGPRPKLPSRGEQVSSTYLKNAGEQTSVNKEKKQALNQ